MRSNSPPLFFQRISTWPIKGPGDTRQIATGGSTSRNHTHTRAINQPINQSINQSINQGFLDTCEVIPKMKRSRANENDKLKFKVILAFFISYLFSL